MNSWIARFSTTTLIVITTLVLITGCMEMASHAERINVASQGELYKSGKTGLPAINKGATRLYFYRSQVMLGFLASPIVIVNGHWMGTKDKPNENLFLPGCVFVVDSKDSSIDAWLYQAGKEDYEKKISLQGGEGRTYFMRYKTHPTYVDLEVVDSTTALAEIEALHLSGYRDLQK
ncbi:MAG: hypothetical protein NDI91_08050 [Sulfuritalea sp.]|nr:hypothetical protein [Sulfuritalea sp.]